MGFIEAVKTCLGQYATFTGRARRSEFWFFNLFLLLVSGVGFLIVLATLVATPGFFEPNSEPALGDLVPYFIALGVNVVVGLAFVIPSYAVWARRLHDMGQTGHWLWLNFVSLGIVPLVMAFLDSQPGPNRWGPDPKAGERGQLGGYPPQYGQPQYGQAPNGYAPPAPPQGYQPPAPPQGYQPPAPPQ